MSIQYSTDSVDDHSGPSPSTQRTSDAGRGIAMPRD
jgi:hypothetical protein